MKLYDFWSPTCGPCKRMEPALEAFEEANEGILEVVSVNTADPSNRALTRRYRVNTVPTLIITRDGDEVSRAGGRLQPTHAAIRAWVSKFVPGVR
jgi:thioredoxin 1